jgi:class 3 adenylate cyclase
MDHRIPFYREGTFHVLLGALLIVGGFLGHRVLRARPRRRAGPAAFVSEAVLAVDLVDSTRLATHFGEAVALHARNLLDERIRWVTEQARTFLETTGDGCLVTFPTVAPALASAVALVRDIGELPAEVTPTGGLAVRAGVTYGEVLLDARGVRHGAAINKAFRLLRVTSGDLVELKSESATPVLPARSRILVDEDAAQEDGSSVRLRFVGFARLKGFTGLHALYEADTRAGSLQAPDSGHLTAARGVTARRPGLPL